MTSPTYERWALVASLVAVPLLFLDDLLFSHVPLVVAFAVAAGLLYVVNRSHEEHVPSGADKSLEHRRPPSGA